MKRSILLATTCALFAAPVFAAEPATPAAADPGEIIVTATKREEPLQKVAISMNVFDGQKLAENNISDFKDLANQIPGLNFQISPTVPVVSLRGFSTASSNPGYDQTVAVYQDGIFSGRARQFQAPFFDLARVEVLRGPQGSLLGKNTSAGAVNFVSASPTDEFHAGLASTYLFERDGTNTNAFISGPLSSTIKARLAIHSLITNKGYVANIATGTFDPRFNIFSGRLTLEFEPSDGFDMVTRFEYSDVVHHGTPAANFPQSGPIFSILNYTRNFAGAFGEEDGLRLKPWQFSNNASIELGDLTLLSLTGYQGFKVRSVSGAGTINPETYAIVQSEKWRQGSQEFRLVSPKSDHFEWIAGLYGDVSKYDTDYGTRYNLLGGTVNGLTRSVFSQKAATFSAYATGTYKFTPALRAIIGARYTYIRKHGTFRNIQDFGPPFGGGAGNTQDQTFNENHFDPTATFEYDVAPRVMIYGAYSRGSKGGGFQAANRTVTAAQFALRPERAQSFEAGFKAQAGNWLTFNAAAFQLTFKDQQAGQYIGTPPTLRNVNVGESRSRGVEWTIDVRPARGLSLGTTGAYLDAKYIDYPGAPCTFAQLQMGCVNGTVNAAGRRLTAVPKWSGTAYLNYDQPLSESLKLSFTPNLEFHSSANIDANGQNPLFGTQPGYAKLNGRLGVGAINGGWEVALVARNLLNKLTLNSAFPWGPPFMTGNGVVTRVDESRSIGAQLKLNF